MLKKKTKKIKRIYKHSRKNKRKTFKQQGGSDETNRKYVSSRGIMKSCKVFSSNPQSSIKSLDGIDFTKLTDGCTLYVTGSAIPEFEKILNTLKCKVILVSGDCDETIPDAVFKSNEQFIKFIESDKIIHWYSQNCIGKHPKLTSIPIGLDYHTRIVESRYLGEQMSAEKQENELLEIINDLKPFYERILKCYSNFHFSMQENRKYTGDRRDALKKIPDHLIFKEPSQITRRETFINQSKYAFVGSPHGNGLDCHRTWEALVLGCIPIVKTSGLDPLYDELPVLIVKDWGDITQKLLEKTVNDFKGRKFNYNRLTFKYWMDIINSGKGV